MVTNKLLSDAVHRALYSAAVASVAVSIPVVSQAQDATDEAALEEITVTGSRIAMDANLVTSSPVTTVNAEEIVDRGIVRVEDLINDLPAVVPELTSNESNGATGTATLDLRGLGSDRTLVLTNGHRMGFGDVYALAPDVNQIPGNLIERVELLTGGASSVYGADAVAGVVNFIMKSDFEGFQLDYQLSGYQHKNDNSAVQSQISASGFEQAPGNPNDGQTTSVNLTFGVNTGDGRGNITGYMGYRDIEAIRHSERDYSACALSSSNGETCAGSATIPTTLITPFDGSYYFTVAGDQFVPWDYTYYNYGPLNYFQRPDERYTGGMFAHYDINEKVEGYAEFMFMDDRSLAQIAPSGNFFEVSTINCDNALLSAQQLTAIGCTSPTDVASTYVGRRNVEGGARFSDFQHTSFRQLIGFRGAINDSWSYDTFFNSSRLRYTNVYNNDVSITKLLRATDAVDDGAGNVVCRSVVDGSDPSCVPWNIFREGGVTEAALNYIDIPLFAKADLQMNQFVAFVTGDLTDAGVVVPMASDGVSVVFGIEYRDEKFDFNPDQGYRSGDASGQGGPVAAVQGAILVKELFTEIKVPLVQDRPGFQSLSLDLRYRYSDYDLNIKTDTYNIGGEWTPIENLMLRGGFSRAVRAPNIRELFEPQTLGLWSGTDPCAGPTPELTEAQCANTGVLPGRYGVIPLSPAGQYNALFGGNTTLQPEESDSVTFGAVWTPDELISGLSLSVDYWRIELTDAIDAGLGEEFTIRQCGLTGDAQFCSLINRAGNGALWISDGQNVLSTNINIGLRDVAGVDLSGTYATDIGRWGGLDFNFRATVLTKAEQFPFAGSDVEDCLGKWGGTCARARPEYKHTFNTVWSSPWDTQFVLGWRHISEVKEFNLNRYTAGAEDYIDLSATYSADWLGGSTEITVGISNVTDNEPPVNGYLNNVATYSNGNTLPGTWDALGRYWFVGLSQGF